MSGGIDSFVTALMLQQKGYEVIGVNLQLWGKNDLAAVQKVCDKLHIPLINRNGEELFRQVVVDSFVQGYLAGSTPSPCCICNSYIKWELLKQAADEVGAYRIATGHYVKIGLLNGHYYIRKGIDIHKDQSYFLWGIAPEILARAFTPLGDYTKEQVKAWALEHGYEEMVRKRESMGVCFLRGDDYRNFIQQYSGNSQQPGMILDRNGGQIGEHSGLLNYTIGQKRGMPLKNGQPLYVAEMDAVRNVIVADVKSGLFTSTLLVDQVQVVNPEDLDAPDITVKIRGIGLNPEGYVSIEKLPGNRLKINLIDPAWAVAPGQPVAFFRGDLVIGGGFLMFSI